MGHAVDIEDCLMIDTVQQNDASLPQLLATRARQASDGRLVLDTVLGMVAALASTWWHGPGWIVLSSAALCFFAFGVWGIADRELGEQRIHSAGKTRVLHATRVAATAVGALSAVMLALSVLAIALGRMIS